jgi:hypothetical protein
MDKVKSGLTTIEELMRIAAPPEEMYFKKNEIPQTKTKRGEK